jgi:hypothetical protein
LPLLASVQCTGTETENPASPLISFEGSNCKKDISLKALPAPGRGTQGVDTGKAVSFDSSYDGLQCIAWRKSSVGSFRFELGNFHASCGIDDWKGSASVAEDGTVALHAVNSQCKAAACGWCMYDWTFDVRGLAEGTNAHLSINIVNDDGKQCDSAVAPYDVTIPTADSDQGTLCRPAFRNAADVFGRSLDTPGKLHMPCDASVATPCVGELSCGPLASSDDDLRCLARCSTDSDCPLPGILTCQAQTCRLTQIW